MSKTSETINQSSATFRLYKDAIDEELPKYLEWLLSQIPLKQEGEFILFEQRLYSQDSHPYIDENKIPQLKDVWYFGIEVHDGKWGIRKCSYEDEYFGTTEPYWIETENQIDVCIQLERLIASQTPNQNPRTPP